jgi:hypothetical protein
MPKPKLNVMHATSPQTSPKPARSVRARGSRTSAPKLPARLPLGYNVPDSSPVLAVIAKHRPLETLLDDIFKALPHFFDSLERVDLRIMYDDPSCLIVRVITQDPDAIDRLDRFYDKWWYPNETRLAHRLYVTLGHA